MNKIHHTSIIENSVVIEDDVEIGPFCVISGNVKIGRGTRIFSHVSIGTLGEYPTRTDPEFSKNPRVEIGSNVTIREFVTINSNVDDGMTKVGDSCYLMTKCHIGHDVILDNNVVCCSNSAVGGYSRIGKFTYVGLNASVHQRSIIGSYCMIGANSFFKGVSPDGITWAGVPALPKKLNLFNLQKNIEDLNTVDMICKNAEQFITEKY